jgi:putative hydrolase of the HAD superfamily
MASVRAVLFDLGNVLCHVDTGRMRRAFTAETGLSSEQLDRALFGAGLKEALDRGRLAPAEVTERIGEALGISMTLDRFSALWNHVLLPWPEMDALARRVATALPCGLLSNTDPIHHALARSTYPALAALPVQVVSYEIGALKPEPAIYEAASAAMGVAPGELLFVDDLSENVEAARAAGMAAHWFRGIPGLREELATHGIPT